MHQLRRAVVPLEVQPPLRLVDEPEGGEDGEDGGAPAVLPEHPEVDPGGGGGLGGLEPPVLELLHAVLEDLGALQVHLAPTDQLELEQGLAVEQVLDAANLALLQGAVLGPGGRRGEGEEKKRRRRRRTVVNILHGDGSIYDPLIWRITG